MLINLFFLLPGQMTIKSQFIINLQRNPNNLLIIIKIILNNNNYNKINLNNNKNNNKNKNRIQNVK